MKFSYIQQSKTGIKRKNNEDAIGISEADGGLLVIVCDGLGGNNAGEVASNLCVNSIREDFSRNNTTDCLRRIKDSIENANAAILKESSGENGLSGMATTAEVLYIKDKTIYWGHVGDSRIYMLKNNKLKQLTKDHSLIQKLIDEGYLTLNQAESHPNKNIILRALGDAETVEIDLSKLKLFPSDEHRFFICTDGVTNVVSDNELEELLQQKDPEFISKHLTKKIEERGAPDNFSYVILYN